MPSWYLLKIKKMKKNIFWVTLFFILIGCGNNDRCIVVTQYHLIAMNADVFVREYQFRASVLKQGDKVYLVMHEFDGNLWEVANYGSPAGSRDTMFVVIGGVAGRGGTRKLPPYKIHYCYAVVVQRWEE